MGSAQLIALIGLISVAAASVVKTSQPRPEGTFELLILHNNDMHARFEQTSQLSGTCTTADRDAGKCYGGFPRVAYLVKKAREEAASGEGPPVLYLNAGDTYTGTAWFTIYKWKIAAEFVNALQPDAVSLGNHEFDNGVLGLTPFIENLTSPVLAANLLLSGEPTLQAETNLMNSIIFNINDTKVAVIGYLTPETKVLAIGNNVEYIEEVKAIREEIEKLKKENVTIFIALGHSGFDKDIEIAEKVADIDLVIGGHTNTFLWNGTSPDSEKAVGPYPTLVKQASGRVVPVVQAYAYTKYLGKLHILFDTSGEIVKLDGNPILLDNSVPQDPDVLTIINKYRDSVLKFSEVVVGNTSVVLDNLSCKTKECNLGNLITDAMVDKYANEYNGTGWNDAPVAIIQRGGIRAPIAHMYLPANVTKGDLLTVLPFDGKMVRKTINGSTIAKMLEYAVSRYTPAKAPGEFLQFSGMKVEYDLKKPVGSRVARVRILCGQCDVPEYINLNTAQEYNILMSSFLSMGGDGYSMFIDLPSLSLEYNELDCLTQYFQKHSSIYSAVEDRITFTNDERLRSSASPQFLSLAAISVLILSAVI